MASAEPITSLSMLLAECGLSHLSANLASETLALAEQERTLLLATLKTSGVAKLGDRQAAASAIAKAKKAGRLRPGNPLDVPPEQRTEPAVSFLPAPTGPLPSGRKPKLVLLHGGATNPKIFEFQLAPLYRRCKDAFDLVHIEGHFVSKDGLMVQQMKKSFGSLAERVCEYAPTTFDGRGWWTYGTMGDTALRNLERSLSDLGDADFLVGFSQGANFAVMLAARAALKLPGSRPPFRGIILLEPDLPGWVNEQPGLFSAALPVPAVVVGATKHVAMGLPAPPAGPAPAEVVDTAADEVAKLLASPTVLKFADSHRPLPADKMRADEIVEAICAFVNERCSGGSAVEVS